MTERIEANMAQYSKKELEQAKFVKEQELYLKEGYKKAAFLGRTLNDYENHLYAYLIDLSICLLPVYVWGVEFILILSGVIPPAYFDLLFYIMYALLFLASCILLPLYTAAKGGYTWGGKMMGLRLVSMSKKPASAMRLVMRELLGIGAPMMLFGYFFSIIGILIWWLLNGLCVVLSPQQRTIFDNIFGLVTVYVPRYGMKIVPASEKDGQEQTENAKPKKTKKAASKNASKQPKSVKKAKPAESSAVQSASNSSAASKAGTAAAAGAAAASSVHPTTESQHIDAERISGIDLHIRSNYSDDADTEVEDIFRIARDRHMDVISITDHNNARANAQAVRFAGLYNIQYIPGVEIDCELYGERVRILGYYIDWTDPFFDEIERLSLTREKNVSMERIRCFEKAAGLKVDSDALLSNSRFKLLPPKELTNLVFDNPQARKLPTVSRYIDGTASEEEARRRFFADYFGEGGICEIKVHYPSVLKVIQAIHKAGGLAILSGWRIDKLSDEVIGGLLEGGLDGFEVFSPRNSDRMKEFLLHLAAAEKALITGGSDYHGTRIPGREIGRTGMSEKGEKTVRLFTRAASRPKSIR